MARLVLFQLVFEAQVGSTDYFGQELYICLSILVLPELCGSRIFVILILYLDFSRVYNSAPLCSFLLDFSVVDKYFMPKAFLHSLVAVI